MQIETLGMKMGANKNLPYFVILIFGLIIFAFLELFSERQMNWGQLIQDAVYSIRF